jgi:cell division protein FtsI (penicillin-binding protein 3)
MSAEELWQSLNAFGFGQATGVSFPAESSGYLRHFTDWHPLDHATVAFGYGLSVSTLQLARAYSVFAADGVLRPVSMLVQDEAAPGQRVMSEKTARAVLAMMEQVVGPKGTARNAAVRGYRVAGKTGTVKKTGAGGYLEDSYVAVFAGIAPVSAPRLVMVVMIDQPRQNGYYGGQVAAPVFSEVLTHALRLMNISPDDLPSIRQIASSQENKV